VLCWFADCFSILQHHLTLDVAYWLRRWALWTTICPISGSSLSPTHCWPFCLSSLCLLKVRAEINSCPSPLLRCTQSTPPPLLHVPFSSLFIIQAFYFYFFAGQGVSLSRGLCWLIPGVAMGVPHVTYLLTCWSASPKQVWSWHLAVQEPSCFLSLYFFICLWR
jgi:hypothetical protein